MGTDQNKLNWEVPWNEYLTVNYSTEISLIKEITCSIYTQEWLLRGNINIIRMMRKISALDTNLWWKKIAGSMLVVVIRTTWRISLAIIRSFSKFTRPSTYVSLPEQLWKGRIGIITRNTAGKVKLIEN